MMDERHLAFLIADVSDKGVPAALFMMSAKDLINYRASLGGTPGEILMAVNNQLARDNKNLMFVTIWMGILNLDSGEVTFALNNNFGDVVFMLGAGIIGFFLLKLDFSMPPIILGLLLGNTVESNLRRAMTLANGKLGYFLTRPITVVLLIISVLSLFYPIIMPAVKKYREKKKAA